MSAWRYIYELYKDVVLYVAIIIDAITTLIHIHIAILHILLVMPLHT